MSDNRTPLIAGNWKMNKTVGEAKVLAQAIVEGKRRTDVDVLVAPPFTALASVATIVRGSGILLGAQNMHWAVSGAFTGEISAEMIKAVGCTHVILGHSERRQYFGEMDAGVNEKVKAALAGGLTPIICIGETLEEREDNKTFQVIERQLWTALQGLTSVNFGRSVIAYEPVWAIGTGETATPDQAQEVHHYVRGLLADILDKEVAKSTIILYGGSVKPENIKKLMEKEDIDGALVGGASLKAEVFLNIINF